MQWPNPWDGSNASNRMVELIMDRDDDEEEGGHGAAATAHHNNNDDGEYCCSNRIIGVCVERSFAICRSVVMFGIRGFIREQINDIRHTSYYHNIIIIVNFIYIFICCTNMTAIRKA